MDEDHDATAKTIAQVLRDGASSPALRAPPNELLASSGIHYDETFVTQQSDEPVKIPVRNLFDVVTTTKRCKHSSDAEENKDVNLLILQAGGAHDNELTADRKSTRLNSSH